MTSDWPRVKRVLERALTLDGEARQAYLDDACGADAALRDQVEALVDVRDRVGTFLETPAAMQLEVWRPHEDLSGRTVSSYQLLSRLGAGGMGEVYLAHDSKLDRPVAVKFLSPELVVDHDRLRRFHQEARAASSLNHPHIVVVHDFGDADGRPYMVTEFIEGETLRRRLARGPLASRDVLEIGVQLAGALAAAHARGLVHRDIKPDNVMVRPDGYVKVLDFGLAKLATPQASSGAGDGGGRTIPGTVMGTPLYMSPEQARGQELDARTDVWSFGVVLYELVTGRPPFQGDTPADAIAMILSADPPPLGTQGSVAAPGLGAIVARALCKERRGRYADAEEMLSDLRRVAASAASDVAATLAVMDGDPDATVSSVGERRRATVLVSLVSDYAALLERLPADAIDAVIGRLRAAAVDTMRQYGGVVNQSIGEEIVSLFGIPIAHEDDDLRAVRAAFDLHARAREIADSESTVPGVRIALQSGVHAGPVVVQRLREGPRRYALTGSPVEAASRLAAGAESEAIWISADCQRRVAPFVSSEPCAAVSVRTDAPPVTAYRVTGEPSLVDRLESPDRSGLTPYTGRTAELSALSAQVDAARRGDGRLVVVAGEAGSGKSRLLHELRTHLASSGFQVLLGRCRSYGGVTSYLPFVEALKASLDLPDQGSRRDVAQLVSRIRSIDASLEPFIPLYLHLLSTPSDVFPVPRHLRGEHLQAAMLDALAAFFTSQAQRTPGLLLLEDWHWADAASRAALRHLAEVVTSYPLLVVLTTRPEPGTGTETPDAAVRLDLSPLPFPASLEIIKAVLDVESLPDALARRLHERTGGNPFFLEEMCQGLREAGIVTAHGSEAVLSAVADAIQLPDTVQAVIRSRLDRLNTDGREVLRVASVIGREFARSVLHHAMDVEDLTGPIERLKAAAIIQQVKVVPEPVYRFKHALSQEVAYESLLEHQRKSLHLAVGRAIERCATSGFDDALEQLAYHFSRADAWEEAIHYGLRASERATELSQFGDALTLLENVHAGLLHLPDGPERRDRIADVLLGQERLCETLGLRGRQLQLSGELIALLAPNGASRRLAESYLRQGDVSTLLKRFDAADRALATALRMSRERGDAALERSALRSIGLLRWHQGRHLEALTITENALEIDREREDELAVAGDLSNLGNVLRSLGRHERALEVLEEALAMPVVAADPIKRAYILHMVASVHRTLGDVPRALGYLQEADQSALTHMLPIQRAFHLTSIAHIQLAEGRVSECLRLYQEAVELSRRARHADGLAQSLRMLGEVLFGLGREGDALPHLREAAQLFAQLEDHDGEAVIRRYTALTLERDRPADAVPEWERVRDLSQASGDAHAELSALEGIARASRRLVPGGDETVRRFEEALVLAVRLGQHAHEASLRNTLGILNFEQGRYGAALEHYEAGLRLTRGAGSGAHEGLILNSIGVTLTRLSRYEEARTVLEEALAVNGRTGEKQLEGHTLAALGTVAENTGRCDAAIACFEASLAIRREAGDRPGEGWMLHHLARTRALMGDAAGAETSLDSAARIAAECGDAALGRAIEQFASNASGVAGAQGE